MSRDWGAQAQQAAEERVNLCNEWLEWYEEGGGEAPRPELPDPSVAPYCGCQTCLIRESLDASWPIIEAGVRSGDFG